MTSFTYILVYEHLIVPYAGAHPADDDLEYLNGELGCSFVFGQRRHGAGYVAFGRTASGACLLDDQLKKIKADQILESTSDSPVFKEIYTYGVRSASI